MNEEKQIEEMAMLITEGARQAIEDADAIYKAGYRKALEVIRDFIEKAKEIFVPEGDYDGTDVIWNLEWLEAELEKKYTGDINT